MTNQRLKDFARGWIIGDFQPALVQSKDVEVGILYLKAGEKGDGHFHKLHAEINIIARGSARIPRGEKWDYFFDGDIFTFEPFEKSTVEYMEDTILVVVKTPATKGDKFYDPKD